jgi:hypothetical protein
MYTSPGPLVTERGVMQRCSFFFVVQMLTTKIKWSSVSQKRYFHLIFTVEKAELKEVIKQTATFPRS